MQLCSIWDPSWNPCLCHAAWMHRFSLCSAWPAALPRRQAQDPGGTAALLGVRVIGKRGDGCGNTGYTTADRTSQRRHHSMAMQHGGTELADSPAGAGRCAHSPVLDQGRTGLPVSPLIPAAGRAPLFNALPPLERLFAKRRDCPYAAGASLRPSVRPSVAWRPPVRPPARLRGAGPPPQAGLRERERLPGRRRHGNARRGGSAAPAALGGAGSGRRHRASAAAAAAPPLLGAAPLRGKRGGGRPRKRQMRPLRHGG
ncbi:uncharacterized protein LOC142411653 [Mycteria americana]|uniref:uncharacterized protein LOC142411653 n=1 Tax=Mycteria americana TaxID=33587 RepID=UPI003F5818AC